MARKPAQAVRHGRPPLPFWVWLLTGFVLGVVLSAVFIFRDFNQDPRQSGAQANPNAQPKPVTDPGLPAGQGTVATAAQPPTSFDFYRVLPEREVVIPDEELTRQNQRPIAVIEPNTRYWLQVGSFPKMDDADSMKARLALQGIKVQVAPIELNGVTWHRVRTGPYDSTQTLEQSKRALLMAGVEAFAYSEKLGQ